MTEKMRKNSPYNIDWIYNPSEPIQCPACDDSFKTRQGFSRHARIHVDNGELIAYIKNPNADIHLQRYAYRLPDEKQN